jgi:carboxypeptidase-like protein
MKCLPALIFIIFSISSFSQERAFYGRIIDKDTRLGIPHAAIQAKGRFDGLYCDENGAFSFKGNVDSVKDYLFYGAGYEHKEVSVKNWPGDSAIIELQKEYIEMDEVSVTSKKGKIKEGILGVSDSRCDAGAYEVYGDEVAIFLKANPKRKCYLKNVFVYITDEGIPDTRFKIHVYQKDSASNWPSYEITDGDVTVHAVKGDEWVSIDLSNKQIPVKDGIFISVEWIHDKENDERSWHKELSGCYSAGSQDNNFNGMVLGLSWLYETQSLFFLSYKKTHDRWNYVEIFGGKPYSHNFKYPINPMIYCTYNYVK